MTARRTRNGKLVLTHPSRITELERQALALELKRKGWSTGEIGRELGIEARAAYGLVRRAMEATIKEMATDARQLRMIDDARLEAMYKAVAPAAEKGHLGAIDRAVKILERRARMWGYDLRPPDVHVDQSQHVIVLPAWGEEPPQPAVEGEAVEEEEN